MFAIVVGEANRYEAGAGKTRSDSELLLAEPGSLAPWCQRPRFERPIEAEVDAEICAAMRSAKRTRTARCTEGYVRWNLAEVAQVFSEHDVDEPQSRRYGEHDQIDVDRAEPKGFGTARHELLVEAVDDQCEGVVQELVEGHVHLAAALEASVRTLQDA